MGINPPSDAYAINVMLLKRAIRRRRTMATLSIQLTTNLIATGNYIGVLPRSVAHYTRRVGLKILPARLTNQRIAVGIITVKNRTLSPLASLFLDRARKVAAPLQQM